MTWRAIFSLLLLLAAAELAADCSWGDLSVSAETCRMVRDNPLWNDAGNRDLWSHRVSLDVLVNAVSAPRATDRGRVRIAKGTVVADNGHLLRGEHVRMANNPSSLRSALDLRTWLRRIRPFRLNVIRLLVYRPPQNWGGGPGAICPVTTCFPRVEQAIPYIDAMVEIASALGVYLVVDYHPVGGYDREDAFAWWRVMAPRYAQRTHVLYDLVNEPVQWSAGAYKDRDIAFESELYAMVRRAAPETHITVWSFAQGSGSGSSMLRVVRAGSIDSARTSVGFHPYGSFNEEEPLTLRRAGWAVFATEVGGNNRSTYSERTQQLERLAISWIWLDGTGERKPWEKTNPQEVTWEQDPRAGAARVSAPQIDTSERSTGVLLGLSTPTLGAEIRYTTDGSLPTETSQLYSGALTITDIHRVRARAFKKFMEPSETTALSDDGG